MARGYYLIHDTCPDLYTKIVKKKLLLNLKKIRLFLLQQRYTLKRFTLRGVKKLTLRVTRTHRLEEAKRVLCAPSMRVAPTWAVKIPIN